MVERTWRSWRTADQHNGLLEGRRTGVDDDLDRLFEKFDERAAALREVRAATNEHVASLRQVSRADSQQITDAVRDGVDPGESPLVEYEAKLERLQRGARDLSAAGWKPGRRPSQRAVVCDLSMSQMFPTVSVSVAKR